MRYEVPAKRLTLLSYRWATSVECLPEQGYVPSVGATYWNGTIASANDGKGANVYPYAGTFGICNFGWDWQSAIGGDSSVSGNTWWGFTPDTAVVHAPHIGLIRVELQCTDSGEEEGTWSAKAYADIGFSITFYDGGVPVNPPWGPTGVINRAWHVDNIVQCPQAPDWTLSLAFYELGRFTTFSAVVAATSAWVNAQYSSCGPYPYAGTPVDCLAETMLKVSDL